MPLSASKLADLDEKEPIPVTLGRPKKKLINFLPGGQILSEILDLMNLELANSGQILWLFRP